MSRLFLLIFFIVASFDSGSNGFIQSTAAKTPFLPLPVGTYTSFPETFESGSKSAYSYGTVTLSTGIWGFDDALLGSSESDKKVGAQSVRMINSGKLTMLFNVTDGISKVSILHGIYGSDASANWGLWYSTNDGVTWLQAASNISTSSSVLVQTTFTLNLFGDVRLEIRKVGGGRINIDNISIDNNSGACCCCMGTTDTIPTRDDNMAMGNPSSATSSISDSNNFLLIKHQYALSYNNSKGTANWVSWHLSLAWKGDALRCDCFTQDATLPAGYYRAATSHYTGSGFDRGHLCPSDDRDASDSDNAATFKMTNIAPQAPDMNQITWAAFESYCRTLITHGNELYIISGCYGTGGSGSAGGTTYNIYSGAINVPAHYWKVVVVLPVGVNDVSRVSATTRIIAIDMDNAESVTAHTWDYYRTTTDAIEAATGYNILSNIPVGIQTVIESTVDTGPTF
ncbi:MAG: DNA/RNA non-specific endonuclease [Taibaiella sp.]|nr:DNA/RNA non-specific endonuclease [Taibaiella sp.]